MYWLEHEYLVPIIIGCTDESLKLAKKVKGLTGLRSHIFAERFSVFQKLMYNCHVVSPMKVEFLTDSLVSFADALDNFEFSVIITDKNDLSEIFGKYTERVESSYVVGYAKDLER